MADLGPFEFDLTTPASWRNFNPPPLDPRVPEELLCIGGTNSKGEPRLRVVWGGAEQVYYEGDDGAPAGWYLKYHLCFTPPRIVGWGYHDARDGYRYYDPKDKRTKRVSLLESVPANALRVEPVLRPIGDIRAVPKSGMVAPVMRNEEIGKPRWIVEIWRERGDMNGFFQQSGYYHLLTVQGEPVSAETGMGPYREVGEDVLETLRGMFNFMENTTEAQREALRQADEEREKERKQKAREAIWEDAAEAQEKIIRDAA